MDYKLKRSGSYEVEIFLEFKPSEVEESYQSAYQDARGRMKMDGFRKGKIPLEVVEKTLGDSVLEEVSNHLLRTALADIFDDLDPAPLNMPEFSVEKIDRKKGAKIKGTYHTRPTFKLAKYKKIKVVKDQAIVTDELITKELEKLQKEKAVMHTREESEVVQSGDVLQAGVAIKQGGKQIFENKDASLEMTGNALLPGLTEKIIGLKSGELNEFDLIIPDDFSDAELAGKTVNVSLEIKEIKYAELPELNDEFAIDMGEYKTIDELRLSLQKKMQEHGDEHVDSMAKTDLLRQIASSCDIEIPPSMIESESVYRVDQMAEQMGIKFPTAKKPAAAKSSRGRKKSKTAEAESKLSLAEKIDYIIALVGMEKEKFEEDLKHSAKHSVGEQLVLREIIEKEKITATEDEIIEKLKSLYGTHFDDSQIGPMLEIGGLRSGIESQLLTQKAFDLLFSLADVKKGKEIPVDQIGKTNEM